MKCVWWLVTLGHVREMLGNQHSPEARWKWDIWMAGDPRRSWVIEWSYKMQPTLVPGCSLLFSSRVYPKLRGTPIFIIQKINTDQYI